VVISGKGGTGKTTVTASFSALAASHVVADCDVDAADLHILLNPTVEREEEFKGSKLAVIDHERCTECGICEEYCRFDAINDLKIDPILCEGCGVCAEVCPVEAINLEERVSGRTFISDARYGPMSHARLNAAEAASGKLVTLVRFNARKMAEERNLDLIIIDGPPGIGCPVIASLTGVDLALIVTEPTMSGLHDLRRMLGVVNHFGITPLVCINMYDINREKAEEIAEFCRSIGVSVIGRIAFDPIATKAMIARKPVVEYSPNSLISKEIKDIWNRVLELLGS
jgi:MinD superfamily P-loop ATPase